MKLIIINVKFKFIRKKRIAIYGSKTFERIFRELQLEINCHIINRI
jgi:hypothetical protein